VRASLSLPLSLSLSLCMCVCAWGGEGAYVQVHKGALRIHQKLWRNQASKSTERMCSFTKEVCFCLFIYFYFILFYSSHLATAGQHALTHFSLSILKKERKQNDSFLPLYSKKKSTNKMTHFSLSILKNDSFLPLYSRKRAQSK